MLELVAQGIGVGVALAAPVGPINIEIVRRGLIGGFWNGWIVGLGALSADTMYCTLVVIGLLGVADTTGVRAPLFLVGAVVLCYLGVRSIVEALRHQTILGGGVSRRRGYVTGFMMAAASPFGIVYWLSIGAALVTRAVEQSGEEGAPVLVSGVFLGILCWVTFLSALTQGGRRVVSPTTLRWATVVAGIVLVAFGVSFLIQGIEALTR